MTNVGGAADDLHAPATRAWTASPSRCRHRSRSPLAQTGRLRHHVHPTAARPQRLHRRPAHLDRRQGHVVRIPMVVRPVALAAPAEVNGSYSVTFGYDGPFTATARGLVPAAVTPGTVADDPTDGTCSLTSPNAQLIPVAIPAGTTYARFSLFDADVNAGSRPRPVRVQQRRHSRRLERLRHLGRGGQSAQPGRRHLHRRRPGLGRRRLDAVQAPHLAARLAPRPAT